MNFSKNDKSDAFAALSALALAVFAAGAAMGCDTPVYRYAMYNWSAAPYRVFFFHDPHSNGSGSHADGSHADGSRTDGSRTDGQAQQANRLLLELSTSDRPLNVDLIDVDVSDQASIDRLPDEVKESLKRWQERDDSQKPGGFHLLFSPWGRELFAGRLDINTVRAMAASPARNRLCELLQEGCIVAVCLTPKKNANSRSVGLVEVAVRALPEVELLVVSASDPKETWFVKNLLSAEPDLEEEKYAGQTMVFMAYGRGRIMLPYIGKGVTAENLARGAAFLAGDCSCQAKAGNPGIDLLTRWDWAAAAEAMSVENEDASDLDGQLAYYEFDPGELSDDQDKMPATRLPDNESADNESADNESADNESADNELPDNELPDGSFAARQAWYLGGGLALAVAIIAISGFFVMRGNTR